MKFQTYDVMLNGYYDFDNLSSTFVPYVGVGAGYTHIKGTANVLGFSGHGSDNKAAVQGIAGVKANLTEKVSAFAGYRYFTTLNGGDRFQNNLVNVGLTYHF